VFEVRDRVRGAHTLRESVCVRGVFMLCVECVRCVCVWGVCVVFGVCGLCV
jgi:hypothetical protein